MKNRQAEYEERLRETGLKRTKQRIAILDIFAESDRPLPAEEVFLLLKEKHISVNLSTIYRTLEILAEKELLAKVSIAGDSRTLYEYNRQVHRHYLVCMGCKKIVAIHHCPLEAYEKSLAEETQYAIAGHRLDVYGYCPECRHAYDTKENRSDE